MDSALTKFCGQIVDAASNPSLREIDGALEFPKDMCTWMSYAAGELLHENGFGVWEIQNAQRPGTTSRHDWLVKDDLYVDLTAHQFREFSTHLIGTVPNPVSALFSISLGRYPTSGITNRTTNLQYKMCLGKILGLESQD